MKKLLSIFLILFTVFSVNTFTSSNEQVVYATHNENKLFKYSESKTKHVTITRKYPRPYQEVSHCRKYPNNVPIDIWYEIDGYVGYLSIESWSASRTHYEVTYSGTLRRGNFAPLNIEEVNIDE